MVDTVTRHELDLAMRRLRDEFKKALAGVDTGEAGAAVSVARAAEAAAATATEATIAMDKQASARLSMRWAQPRTRSIPPWPSCRTPSPRRSRVSGGMFHRCGARPTGRKGGPMRSRRRCTASNGEWTEAAAGRADALTRYVDDEIRKVREAMAEAV